MNLSKGKKIEGNKISNIYKAQTGLRNTTTSKKRSVSKNSKPLTNEQITKSNSISFGKEPTKFSNLIIKYFY